MLVEGCEKEVMKRISENEVGDRSYSLPLERSGNEVQIYQLKL